MSYISKTEINTLKNNILPIDVFFSKDWIVLNKDNNNNTILTYNNKKYPINNHPFINGEMYKSYNEKINDCITIMKTKWEKYLDLFFDIYGEDIYIKYYENYYSFYKNNDIEIDDGYYEEIETNIV